MMPAGQFVVRNFRTECLRELRKIQLAWPGLKYGIGKGILILRPSNPDAVRNQMDRLFHATVQLMYKDEKETASVGSLIADRTQLWWDPKRPDEPVLWESTREFFNEIIRRPVPLDIHILKALKRSSLGLDLYMWLVYRTFALNREVQISWRQLYWQFGANPVQSDDKFVVRNFRTECLRELRKIQLAWPGLKYGIGKGILILRPSKPSVPRLETRAFS